MPTTPIPVSPPSQGLTKPRTNQTNIQALASCHPSPKHYPLLLEIRSLRYRQTDIELEADVLFHGQQKEIARIQHIGRI